MSLKRINFLLGGQTLVTKLVSLDSFLVSIRSNLTLQDNVFFSFENRKIDKSEESNKKLREITTENEVRLIEQNPLIKIKQQDIFAFETNSLSSNSYLSQLRSILPTNLQNEKFIIENNIEIERKQENEITVSDIAISNIIYMSGSFHRNLRDIGSIKIDHSKSVADNLEMIKSSENNIIFFGRVGAGKTTLTNILCGTNFETAERGFSKTRIVQFAQSLNRGDFIAIDFPGLGAEIEKLNHYETQRQVLSIIPSRMVCFVVKNDNRYDEIIKQIKAMKAIFDEFKSNIVIIITHSEEIKNNIREQSNIEAVIKTKCNYENIIFSYKDIRYTILTEKLLRYLNRMQNIPCMDIKTRNLINSVGSELSDDIFKDIRAKFRKEFDDTLAIFKTEFDKYREENENTEDDKKVIKIVNKDNYDIKRALFFALKLYKDKHMRKYNSEIIKIQYDGEVMQKLKERDNIFGKEDNDDDKVLRILDYISCEIIMYNNSIYNDFKEFCQKIHIGIQSTNYKNEYNRFKKCPHCGTIWFRISGCYDVFCGKRSSSKDQIFGRFKNYIVQYANGSITITHDEVNIQNRGTDNILNSESCLLTNDEKEKNKNLSLQHKQLIKPIGCGVKFNWDEAEDVTDSVIFEMMKDIGRNLSDYDADVLEIKKELYIKQTILKYDKEKYEILYKIKRNDYHNDQELNDLNNEMNDYSQIISKYNGYNSINLGNENYNEIKENSSKINEENNKVLKNKKKILLDEVEKLIFLFENIKIIRTKLKQIKEKIERRNYANENDLIKLQNKKNDYNSIIQKYELYKQLDRENQTEEKIKQKKELYQELSKKFE